MKQPTDYKIVEVEPLLLRVDDACRIIAVSRAVIYRLVTAGELRIIKIDRSSRFALSDLRAFVERRITASAGTS